MQRYGLFPNWQNLSATFFQEIAKKTAFGQNNRTNGGKWDNKKGSVCLADPHFQEPVRNAIHLCTFLVLIGQKLFLQQGADGILDGTGGFKCMLLHESNRSDACKQKESIIQIL